MDVISREDLKEKLDRGDDFKLIMALGELAYRAKHIPGPCTPAPRKLCRTWCPKRTKLSFTARIPPVSPAWQFTSTSLAMDTSMSGVIQEVSRLGKLPVIRWKGIWWQGGTNPPGKWSIKGEHIWQTDVHTRP